MDAYLQRSLSDRDSLTAAAAIVQELIDSNELTEHSGGHLTPPHWGEARKVSGRVWGREIRVGVRVKVRRNSNAHLFITGIEGAHRPAKRRHRHKA